MNVMDYVAQGTIAQPVLVLRPRLHALVELSDRPLVLPLLNVLGLALRVPSALWRALLQ